MNNILGKKIELKKGILGTIVVVLGLLGLLFAPSIISIFSLTITGFIAFTLVFGKKDTKKMFSKPVAPVKNIAKYFFINVVISAAVSVFLQQILKWDLTGNPINEAFSPLLFIILPIMILGEELFSVYFLAIFSSKFSIPVASFLSAIIFGFIHYSTYDNGNILHTVAHILLIQGVARLLFNQAAIKSNSIITSWAVHVIFDFTSILLVVLFS
ncbi:MULTISPECIES: CPBP family intramembrane glutamic endopeptidase [Enterococcus]|uniref:CPBP family intramembrane metalloprotease n=2 Tax=Enterococcus faecium TaxID=1352 RepID=A0A242BKX9_ENTFC|nr:MULTISPECIES: CPBP family intramembrane glutamic endopeptidase [Enterococcus]AII39772.1 hypothetical protein M395_10740 [Enterococcus faecium T110]AYM73775.1 CPBP family intramembrane metalloprotease [Enterococcus faecium]EJY43868.1 hypothetical protein HMPREF1348_02195 [Enterococcus faecium 505]EME7220433.1 CPBP family intramembrane metalloprotease [Enterococcus faecium]EME8110823.1 CPBP family intramembrane metalloprotease [Enterococcus faecium]